MKRKLNCFLLLAVLLFMQVAVAQNKKVTGTVTGAQDGLPLPGVNVLVRGTTIGTQTDFDGNYAIEAKSGDVLVFSYLGMKSQSLTVGASNTYNVSLQEDASQLEEVVVTALGLQKQKKALTYATQQVETEELTQARSVNVVEGLSGKVAGLSVTTGGSGVGSASKVLLRGNRSINGSSQPLYVVDGILLNGDISNISPDDIQEISVLKGANAAALYGSRANNGAIIITTKSGKGAKEGVTTNIGFTSTFADPILLTSFQNDYGQGSAGNYSPNAVTSWGPKFDGSQVAHWSNDPNSPEFGSTYAYEAQPDNVKDFFKTGYNVATNIGVNINSEDTNTFLGYTYTDAGGIIPGNNLNRHNITARINTKLTDKLKVDAKINYIRDDFSNVLASGEDFDNPLRYLYILPRNIRTQDIAHYKFLNDEGKLRQHYFRPNFNGGGNPYWSINHITNPRLDERVLGLLSLQYNITVDLSIMGRSTMDRTSRSEERLWYNDTYTRAPNGRYLKGANNSYDWNTDVLINYKKGISEDFALDLSAGANKRVFKSNDLIGDGTTFTIENFFALSNTADPTATETFDNFEVQSVYALAEVSYKNALFLNLTGRNDWSSTLPSANRSYFYPSVGLTAVVSDLVELPEFFSFLKLRGSWAEVGNDTNAFSLSRRADIRNGTLDINPVLPNPDLRPESTRSTEIGFDTRFMDNRFRFDLTWYKSNTFDQIFSTPTPTGSGIAARFQNGADVQNSGLEIVLGATIIESSDFSWDLDINFAKNNSEVLEIADGFDELTISTDFIRSYKLVKGGEFGDVYSRGFLRDDQGRVVVDALGLPQITPGLDVKIANFNPDWLGGIRNSFSYKDFSLSALIDIRQGGTIASFTEAILAGDGQLDYTAQGRDGSLVFGENVYKGETAVTETGASNNIAVNSEDLWNRVGGRNTPVGEAFIRDASNIRLRELVLGYAVSDRFLSKTFLTSARVSLVGRNLFFFSNKAENVDPEAVNSVDNSAEGREAFAPPTTRTFGVSLNLGF
ncbi:TonB-linked outer membrane protein, SusC/RagA family [Arenibacter nanhaiticus]|uniref:TonB-linked outer membrane protein, SusC/RagA family n=1 Tax=Arenibacter nanhaiticus TaxID=558155 RepID=A0A1M6HAQ3_9FLAO|nr:SusC/RagA family TonB-linked outer membrane protein [Arenibacter nanhaiticus]SHJ19327.1 TonB-linked outer membrane protein, SusC/RagA family [Arenibacter nanhaiticus]